MAKICVQRDALLVLVLSTTLILATTAKVTTLPALQNGIDILIRNGANYYNVSLSFSAAFANVDGEPLQFVSSVAGFEGGSKPATLESKYPAGSAAKAFTSVACLRFAEKGLLDLDAPAATYIDPWNKKQGAPSLLETWKGDGTIMKVTVRHLLQMRSGIDDYNDKTLFDWTLKHPTLDYLPQNFVNNVSKTFLFSPGEGGKYSGVGYVMLGMVLASVSGATTWDQLDQEKLIGITLNSTIFMGKGTCAQYQHVVHQYTYDGIPYDLTTTNTKPENTTRANTKTAKQTMKSSQCQAGDPGIHPYCQLQGSVMTSSHQATAGDCCTHAYATQGAAAWEYHDEVLKQGGNCTLFSQLAGGGAGSGTCGILDRKIDPALFTDLYYYSCLNGWTMGNIAVAPQDILRFYYAIDTKSIINATSFAQMIDYKRLTIGPDPPAGTEYGLGVLQTGFSQFPLDNSTGCKCSLCLPYGGKCYLNVGGYGHPGLDWASGMPSVGWYPPFDMGYAMAFNSFDGMNTTMGTLENRASMYSVLECHILNLILEFKAPADTPKMLCT